MSKDTQPVQYTLKDAQRFANHVIRGRVLEFEVKEVIQRVRDHGVVRLAGEVMFGAGVTYLLNGCTSSPSEPSKDVSTTVIDPTATPIPTNSSSEIAPAPATLTPPPTSELPATEAPTVESDLDLLTEVSHSHVGIYQDLDPNQISTQTFAELATFEVNNGDMLSGLSSSAQMAQASNGVVRASYRFRTQKGESIILVGPDGSNWTGEGPISSEKSERLPQIGDLNVISLFDIRIDNNGEISSASDGSGTDRHVYADNDGFVQAIVLADTGHNDGIAQIRIIDPIEVYGSDSPLTENYGSDPSRSLVLIAGQDGREYAGYYQVNNLGVDFTFSATNGGSVTNPDGTSNIGMFVKDPNTGAWVFVSNEIAPTATAPGESLATFPEGCEDCNYNPDSQMLERNGKPEYVLNEKGEWARILMKENIQVGDSNIVFIIDNNMNPGITQTLDNYGLGNGMELNPKNPESKNQIAESLTLGLYNAFKVQNPGSNLAYGDYLANPEGYPVDIVVSDGDGGHAIGPDKITLSDISTFEIRFTGYTDPQSYITLFDDGLRYGSVFDVESGKLTVYTPISTYATGFLNDASQGGRYPITPETNSEGVPLIRYLAPALLTPLDRATVSFVYSTAMIRQTYPDLNESLDMLGAVGTEIGLLQTSVAVKQACSNSTGFELPITGQFIECDPATSRLSVENMNVPTAYALMAQETSPFVVRE